MSFGLIAACAAISKTISKRDSVLFKAIGYLALHARNKRCYAHLQHLGWQLDKYGYKPIKKTQVYEAFSNLKKLNILNISRPYRKSTYEITLNEQGRFLYEMLFDGQKMSAGFDQPDVYKSPEPVGSYLKTGTRECENRYSRNQKPVLSDPDLKIKKDLIFKSNISVDNCSPIFNVYDKVEQLLGSQHVQAQQHRNEGSTYGNGERVFRGKNGRDIEKLGLAQRLAIPCSTMESPFTLEERRHQIQKFRSQLGQCGVRL